MALKSFWGKQDSLERKLFWSILVVVTFTASFSALFTVYEGMNLAASLCSVGCAVMCLAVAGFAVKTSLYNQCYLVMCCMLSCFMLPMLFLFCGGITSGMPLYFVASLMLLAFAGRSWAKVIAFLASLLIQAGLFITTWIRPELIFAELGRDESYLDILVTLVLTGFTVFVIAALAMRAYDQERQKNSKLLARMDYLSSRDSLTEVYNRRYVGSYLENVIWLRRKDFYLLMVNIDNLKRVNDSCGHVFGDQVIMSIAHLLSSDIDVSAKECVGRFDGDSFVCVIGASSEVEAYARVEKIRKGVIQMRWEDFPHVQVTVSGGFAACGNRMFRDHRQLLGKVEELMRQSKSQGKNQILGMVEN